MIGVFGENHPTVDKRGLSLSYNATQAHRNTSTIRSSDAFGLPPDHPKDPTSLQILTISHPQTPDLKHTGESYASRARDQAKFVSTTGDHLGYDEIADGIPPGTRSSLAASVKTADRCISVCVPGLAEEPKT
nr:hypothetical protein CFP56_52760 [Quercus suber]